MTKYKTGTSFAELVKEYTMDGNPDGNLGWYQEGMMIKEFDIEVKKHKRNDIFSIDIPSMKWHYVVFKTFEDRNIKTIKVLKIKSST